LLLYFAAAAVYGLSCILLLLLYFAAAAAVYGLAV
jgi:hypothetical protein